MAWGKGTWGADGTWAGTGGSPPDIYQAPFDPTVFGNGTFTVEIIAVDASTRHNLTDTTPIPFQIALPTPPPPPPPRQVTFAPKPAHDTRIFVRDANFKRVGQLDGPSTITYIVRHHDIGAFTLDMNPYNSDGTRNEAVTDLLQPGAGVVITRDGKTVFSGPVTYRKRSRDNTGKPNVEVTGVDDMIWLAWRQIKQEPSNPAPPYSTNTYDTQTGQVSTVMAHYVNANLGSGATSERQVASISVGTDPAIGGTVTWNGRLGTQLFAALVTLARAGNLGFRLTEDEDTNSLVFHVTPTVDHSADIVFADTLGNITNWTHEHSAATANYLYVGGPGNGTGRTFVEVADNASIAEWGRSEAFLDQRTQSNTGTLTQAGNAQLQQTTDQVAISFEVVQTSGHAWRTDWNIGDQVTAIVDGIAFADLIREIRVDLTPDGETITPTVGTAGATKSQLARKEAKQFRSELSVLEAT